MSARPYSYFHFLDLRLAEMKQGAYYRDGLLRIPSYLYIPHATEHAATEWKKRGLKWDALAREWVIPIPERAAQTQIAKANAIYFSIYFPQGVAQ